MIQIVNVIIQTNFNMSKETFTQSPEIQQLAESVIPEDVKNHDFHAVLLFFRGSDLDIEPRDKWVCTSIRRFNNYASAMNYYANIPCPASQHVSASTEPELNFLIHQMEANYQNEAWLEENLYPYL